MKEKRFWQLQGFAFHLPNVPFVQGDGAKEVKTGLFLSPGKCREVSFSTLIHRWIVGDTRSIIISNSCAATFAGLVSQSDRPLLEN
jgi:hypothetical protein